MRTRDFLLASVLAAFAIAPAANAQSAMLPLSGGVAVNQYGAAQQPTEFSSLMNQALPLAMRLYASRHGYAPAAAQYGAPQYGAVDPNQFQQPAAYPRFSAGLNQTQDQAMAPYVWCQSAQGGYYDETGHCNTNVMAPQLYRYGGRFKDGTPVPQQPITAYNSMGHAYKTAITGGPSFWDH